MEAFFVSINNLHKAISINDEGALNFDFEVPEEFSKYDAMIWRKNNPHPDNPDGIIFFQNDGERIVLEATDENFNSYFKGYVTLWENEKSRIEQERQEAESEFNSIENCKARALVNLNEMFDSAAQRATVVSSLGFLADANRTAKNNVQGLIEEIGDAVVQFCDYHNQFHDLNISQLEILRSEINQNGQNLYAQKWQYRTRIEECQESAQIDAILGEVEFSYLDFSKAS